MTNTRLLENTARWRKTKRGLVTNLYHKMKLRRDVYFDLEFLHEFSNCKKFDRIYNEWVKSKYNIQMKPSIDRIDNKKDYTKCNIHWLTWAENRFKQSMERKCRKGKVAKILNGVIIEIYKSQKDAVIKTGISQSNISEVLNGKRKHSFGYKWAYVSDTEIKGNIYENNLTTN